MVKSISLSLRYEIMSYLKYKVFSRFEYPALNVRTRLGKSISAHTQCLCSLLPVVGMAGVDCLVGRRAVQGPGGAPLSPHGLPLPVSEPPCLCRADPPTQGGLGTACSLQDSPGPHTTALSKAATWSPDFDKSILFLQPTGASPTSCTTRTGS